MVAEEVIFEGREAGSGYSEVDHIVQDHERSNSIDSQTRRLDKNTRLWVVGNQESGRQRGEGSDNQPLD